ncbi:MAG: SPOR domain-containing protein [Saprospiraceae bacterium]|nr:SPOR domain-containing protein [Saprospiraceae bacterium]
MTGPLHFFFVLLQLKRFIMYPSAGKIVFCFFLLIFCLSTARSQGRVEFQESAQIQYIFQSYVLKNRAEPTIRGWRIQIVSTDDRREMESIRNRFSSIYPSVPSTWKHVSPYYQIRIGAYRSKTEMMGFLTQIKKDFPAAIPVQDDIQKYDLIPF